MANHGTSNLASMTIAVVDRFDVDSDGRDVVVARPYAEAFTSYGSTGPSAKQRKYKPANVVALPGKTVADITTSRSTP